MDSEALADSCVVFVARFPRCVSDFPLGVMAGTLSGRAFNF